MAHVRGLSSILASADSVGACQCQTDYRWLRNAIVGMRGYSASESGALQSAQGESFDACV